MANPAWSSHSRPDGSFPVDDVISSSRRHHQQEAADTAADIEEKNHARGTQTLGQLSAVLGDRASMSTWPTAS